MGKAHNLQNVILHLSILIKKEGTMGGLSIFFRENLTEIASKKKVVSNRFIEKGKAVEWEYKSITSREDELLRKSCIKKNDNSQNNRQYQKELDFDLYMGKLAAACTIYPNLKDIQLQNSYGVMGEDTLLKEMLFPGEYSEYISNIQEINGFHKSINELVEEVKN